MSLSSIKMTTHDLMIIFFAQNRLVFGLIFAAIVYATPRYFASADGSYGWPYYTFLVLVYSIHQVRTYNKKHIYFNWGWITCSYEMWVWFRSLCTVCLWQWWVFSVSFGFIFNVSLREIWYKISEVNASHYMENKFLLTWT